MSSFSWPITAPVNATYTVTFTWNNSSMSPINLTSYTAKMQIRQTQGGSTQLLQITSTVNVNGSQIILGGIAGTVQIKIDKVDMQSIPPGSYVYDLILLDASSNATNWVGGAFTVLSAVTLPVP